MPLQVIWEDNKVKECKRGRSEIESKSANLFCCKGRDWERLGRGRDPFAPLVSMSEPPRVQLPAAAVAGLSACWALSPTAPCSDASGTRVSVLLSITLALLSSRGEVKP